MPKFAPSTLEIMDVIDSAATFYRKKIEAHGHKIESVNLRLFSRLMVEDALMGLKNDKPASCHKDVISSLNRAVLGREGTDTEELAVWLFCEQDHQQVAAG